MFANIFLITLKTLTGSIAPATWKVFLINSYEERLTKRSLA
jgi:hypothetical protein